MTMRPGNFELKLLAIGKSQLEKAFSILFDLEAHYGTIRTVEGYSVSKDGMALYTYVTDSDKGVTKFPFKMGEKAALDFVWHWLISNEARETLPGDPDIDGSIDDDAFLLTTEGN